MKVYAVSREGAFRHEIMGIYDEIDVAIARGNEVATEERDDYHQFYVLQFELNCSVRDGNIIAIIRRNKGAVSTNRLHYEDDEDENCS